MKKILSLFLLFIGSLSCYATKVGEEIYYRNSNFGYASVDTYLTKVEPSEKIGYYNIDITSIISPAGYNSAVGLFTYTTHYFLKEKDKIILYRSSTAKTLVVSKISNNEIVFSTVESVLNEE